MTNKKVSEDILKSACEPVEDYADLILKNARHGYTPTHAELDKIWDIIFRAGHGWTPLPFRDSNKSVAEVDARIPDLLFNSPTHVTIQVAEDRIRRAYRRGHHEASKSLEKVFPERNIPEAIPDEIYSLVWPNVSECNNPSLTVKLHNGAILEAYRRGQKAGSK